ncbi:unnamed protein product [Staurois parvus]|uniref:Uncharacterized protein n=1 Tax=Staurois parvus TaxID=386267 RepID=A0ABN9DDY6_9NEOB|nr:unnamed protein product [Staurois parvus]
MGKNIMLDIYTDMDWVMCWERKDAPSFLMEMKMINIQRTESKNTQKIKGITELLDSLRCILATTDGPKHDIPEVFYWI